MAIDTSFGEARKFEDFLVTAIADLPEIDFADGDSATEVVGGAADGRVRLDLGTGNADELAGVSFGDVNWTAGDAYLKMEARIIISATTDNMYFVGFGDRIPSAADETVITAPSDVVTTGTQSDAIGILWDADATTAQLWAVGQKTDVITVEKGLGTSDVPVAAVPTTLGVYLSKDRKSAQFYKDGKEVHRIDSATTLVAAVDLLPGVWAYEQATAYLVDVDYLYGVKGRSVD